MDIDSLDWEPLYLGRSGTWFGFRCFFNLPDWARKGEHSAELRAYAGGQWWKSQPFRFTLQAPDIPNFQLSQ
jgi:hypothetical protein